MLFFRQSILLQIKAASDEVELERIIITSIERLKDKNVNAHIIQRFISGIGADLHREKTKELSARRLLNIDTAINHFRKLQRS